MVKEEWKMIPGYEGLYMVSNWGRVFSIRANRVLKNRFTGRYLQVSLCKNGKIKQFFVHRLVAEAFIQNPDNLPCVNHINEDKTDNRVENLEWCTWEYNNNYGTKGQRISKTKSIEVEQWSLGGELIKVWPSQQEIKRVLGFQQSNISKCCNGERHTAHDFVWKWKQPEAV